MSKLGAILRVGSLAVSAMVLSGGCSSGSGNSGGGSPVTTTIPPAPITVQVSPGTMSTTLGSLLSFTATVGNDTANAGVTWSLGGGVGTLGNVTATQVAYQAPPGLPAATSVTLTATSKTDPTKSGSATISIAAPPTPLSTWVYYDATGNLAYKPLDVNGDQIMDFSTAGYGGGGVTIPTPAVAATVSPSGGDDTAAIQSAINTVSALTQDATTGLRGAVLLTAGSFNVSGTLTISASGVVLRGSGSGATGGTVIHMTAAATPYPLVVVAGSGTAKVVGTPTAIMDAYVPSGTRTLHVADATGLTVGTNVEIHRPITTNWVHFMGMDTLVLSGTPETWMVAGTDQLRTQRTITAVGAATSGGVPITLDAPMSDSIDSTYENPPGGTLNAYTFTGRISQVGVEGFSVIAPAVSGVHGNPSYQLVVASQTMNLWVRNIVAQDTLESVSIGRDCKQVTVSNVAISHSVTQVGSAQFEDFYVDSATQTLFDTVSVIGDHQIYFGTASATQGPTVLRASTFTGDGMVEPHERWATGLLVEDVQVLDGGNGAGSIKLRDRGTDGSGQGWTMGWGVVWNSTAGDLVVQMPPGAQNWMIGNSGTKVTEIAPGGTVILPEGATESHGTKVFPLSLYQAQLRQRLGH